MKVRPFLILPVVLLLAACLGMGTRDPAPVTNYGQRSGAGSAGVHNVVAGDTLYTVSNSYHLPIRDIVSVNNLSAPFRLKEGTRIRLPPPREYRVQFGDTLHDVSRLFGVNSSEVARLNDLRPPYSVRKGQLLRLPSVMRNTQNLHRIEKAVVAPVESEVLTSSAPMQPRYEMQVLNTPQNPQPVQGTLQLPDGYVPPTQGIHLPPPPQMQTVSLSQPKPFTDIPKVTADTPKRTSSKFMRPVNGDIVADYGAKENGEHNDGINISAPTGTSVKAAENGIVVYAGNALKGAGNLVLIRHERQWVTTYSHMDNISVSKGDVVKRGQSIGTVGSTGSVPSPQLHFEVRRGTEPLNPKNYME